MDNIFIMRQVEKKAHWHILRGYIVLLFLFIAIMLNVPVHGDPVKSYIGSKSCGECHEEEYEKFMQFAKKAHSFQSIKKMAKRLTPEEIKQCFECHTTGYGKPGGFVSERETPQLKDAGCEVCHGPGSEHAKTEEVDDIKARLTAKDCEHCHNPERVAAFDYKPLIYGGAH